MFKPKFRYYSNNDLNLLTVEDSMDNTVMLKYAYINDADNILFDFMYLNEIKEFLYKRNVL